MIALNPSEIRTVTVDEVTYTVVEDLSNERVSFTSADQVTVGFAQPCIMSDQIDVFSINESGDVLSSDTDELPSDAESSEALDSRLLTRILALKKAYASI